MSSFPGDETLVSHAVAVPSLTDADRALLLAGVAWGDRYLRPADANIPVDNARDFMASVSGRLAPGWLEALRGTLDNELSPVGSSDPPTALAELRKMHQATARVDLGRVHPSWLLRALREETPAVQRLVTASLPESLRYPIQAGLLLDSQDLKSERAAAPEVATWALALWAERLVGGDARRADDRPAIILLSRLSPRAGYRICRLAGLCKLILAGHEQGAQGRASARARLEWLEARLAAADQELRAMAKRDVETSRSSRLPPRRRLARIGLSTVARLVASSEPFRLRWALQHWPYPVAKVVRSLMPPAANRPPSLLDGESLILKTAWDRLNLEGRLAHAGVAPIALPGVGESPYVNRGSSLDAA